MSRKYTQEHIDFVAANISGCSYKDLTEKFNERFGMELTECKMISLASRNGLKNGINRRLTGMEGFANRYQKGHVPSNAIKKGQRISPKTEFKKGQMPQTYRPVGTETFRADGYWWVKIADPKTWRLKHLLIWEAENGPVPEGHIIIFGDGNSNNFDLNNLICITRSQHAVMNKRRYIHIDAEVTRSQMIVADIISKTYQLNEKHGGK